MGSCTSKPDLPEIPCIKHKLSLNDSMRFHFAYHYSLGIHLNHMLFVQVYLFGVFLCLGSTLQWLSEIITLNDDEGNIIGPSHVSTIAITVFFVSYAALVALLASSLNSANGSHEKECNGDDSKFRLYLVRGFIFAYVLVVGVAAALAVYTINVLSMEMWKLALVGLATILLSNSFELIGHFWFEKFIAKPDIWHGLVATPILCWVSFLFRINLLPEVQDIWNYVTKVRAKHLHKQE